MRRYLQGTLDYCCGMYAVLNALACLYGLELAAGRKMFQETLLDFSTSPAAWTRFMRNETDHYWVVRYMLRRWCAAPPYAVTLFQPFSDFLDPCAHADDSLDAASMYLPEERDPAGPHSLPEIYTEAEAVWNALEAGFSAGAPERGRSPVAALVRFHRFLPGITQPVVSHWTTVKELTPSAAMLHDASAEQGALFMLEKRALMPSPRRRPLLRIVPESLVFLSRPVQGM